MARQSSSPVSFNQTTRKDTSVLMSSGRAGLVTPAGYIPLFAGDSCSGRVAFDFKLKEMPKPLLNGAFVNVQAWFVPKSAFPQFSGRDELMHAMTGDNIKSLGAADRSPPPFFTVVSGGQISPFAGSRFLQTLGIHPTNADQNADIVDAFNLVYNFRLAAHSSRLPRRKYMAENLTQSLVLPPAFWPSSRLSRVVPDYERALVVGSLDLDVAAGTLPITAALASRADSLAETVSGPASLNSAVSPSPVWSGLASTNGPHVFNDIVAEMGGSTIGVTLADIDKARTTQAFAKLRTAYAGNDATGFDNDDTLVSLLMQGISVPDDAFKRPWLLDSQRVPVGFVERNATDGASLDQSVTTGMTSVSLSLNVPKQDVSGIVIFTVELLPERIDERMEDPFMACTEFNDYPNALRDVQRPEPVDLVLNKRIDAKHATPDGLYGYEPMNDKWNRDFTRLGGDFYMATPGGGWTENRSNIWQTEMVNPTFSGTHYLAPMPFPHDVFSDQNADAFEMVVRHAVSITGLTQIGDVLTENNDDYEAISEAGA